MCYCHLWLCIIYPSFIMGSFEVYQSTTSPDSGIYRKNWGIDRVDCMDDVLHTCVYVCIYHDSQTVAVYGYSLAAFIPFTVSI